MKWFEYIIMIVAIGLVFLPFILKIVKKKILAKIKERLKI